VDLVGGYAEENKQGPEHQNDKEHSGRTSVYHWRCQASDWRSKATCSGLQKLLLIVSANIDTAVIHVMWFTMLTKM